jgi:hypothetical protein
VTAPKSAKQTHCLRSIIIASACCRTNTICAKSLSWDRPQQLRNQFPCAAILWEVLRKRDRTVVVLCNACAPPSPPIKQAQSPINQCMEHKWQRMQLQVVRAGC